MSSEAKIGAKKALKQYVKGLMPLLSALGGAIAQNGLFGKSYRPEKSFTFLFMMDMPNKQAAIDLLESENYQKLIPLRDKAFSQLNISLASY